MTEDHDSSLQNRMSVRPEHVARLKALEAEGRLLIAGPHPAIDSPEPGEAGFSGSLIVADFESLEVAEAWANNDPYVGAGVIKHATVKPFNKVLP